jgi:hypothetical protein
MNDIITIDQDLADLLVEFQDEFKALGLTLNKLHFHGPGISPGEIKWRNIRLAFNPTWTSEDNK